MGHHSPHSQNYFRGLIRGWRGPGDVASLLMIVNGDIVQKALAQLSGPRLVPVAFSFDWVIYSIQALTSMIGGGRMMPAADWDSIVVNVASGHPRANRAWVLGRILRDWDYQPKDEKGLYITLLDAVSREDLDQDPSKTAAVERTLLDSATPSTVQTSGPNSDNTDLELGQASDAAIYDTKAPIRQTDRVWGVAWVMIVIQFAIGLVPLLADRDASTLVITAAGTLLALWCGSLSRWREEKWRCRRKTKQTFCLTEGNGSQHVMVISGNGVGLNLEDLASGRVPRKSDVLFLVGIQAILWVALLIAIAREESQTWFLMIVGGLGTLQNVVVAGAPRSPSAFGIYLREIKVIHHDKVRDTLCLAEEEIALLGESLWPIFFPGRVIDADKQILEDAKERRMAKARQDKGEAPEAEAEVAESSGRAGADAGSSTVESRPTHISSEQ